MGLGSATLAVLAFKGPGEAVVFNDGLVVKLDVQLGKELELMLGMTTSSFAATSARAFLTLC